MNKTLRKYLTIGTFALASLIPKLSSAQEINGPTPWEVIGNTFSQPNIHAQVGRNALDWYGSGDVNNDETIDQTDVNQTLGSTSDRADVDGDGTPGTASDQALLQQFVNGNINYLPGHWNELTTEAERISWLEKTLAIQDMTPYFSLPDWKCGNYMIQMQIDFYGISNINEFNGGVEYDKEANARFNIPMYHVGTHNTNNVPHAAGGILVGDNPLDFDDWYFVNYANDNRIFPGSFHMNQDKPVVMGLTAYVESKVLPGYISHDYIGDLIRWNLSGGVPTYASHHDIMITENPNIIEIEVENMDDFLVNYTNPLDTSSVTTGTPNVNVINSSLEAILAHSDDPKVPLNITYPDHHFQFQRNWTASIYSGGVTKEGTGTQLIVVQDIEGPNVNAPADITITDEQPLDSTSTGIATATDNSELPVDLNVIYNFISENETRTIYDAVWTGTDVFSNSGVDTQRVIQTKTTSGIINNPSISPKEYALHQNFPNPFNPTTTIKFGVPRHSNVSIVIYNMLGQKVATLFSGVKSAGYHQAVWQAQRFASGVYYFRLISENGFVQTKKLILLK